MASNKAGAASDEGSFVFELKGHSINLLITHCAFQWFWNLTPGVNAL